MRLICLALALFAVYVSASSLTCGFCTLLLNDVKRVAATDFVTNIYLYLQKKTCLETHDEVFCDLHSQNVRRIEYHAMLSSINVDESCNKLGFCSDATYVTDSDEAYVRRVLANNPPFVEHEGPIDLEHKLRFLVVADVHIDYDYTEVQSSREHDVGEEHRMYTVDLLPEELARFERPQEASRQVRPRGQVRHSLGHRPDLLRPGSDT